MTHALRPWPLNHSALRLQVGKAASTYSASLFSGEGFVTHFTGVACSTTNCALLFHVLCEVAMHQCAGPTPNIRCYSMIDMSANV
jgi:hypothetical protein